jgi:hypothetical protein
MARSDTVIVFAANLFHRPSFNFVSLVHFGN